MSGLAYKIGLGAFWLAGGAVFGAVFAWFWVAPRLMRHSREHNQLTLTEFLSDVAIPRHAERIRIVATAIILGSFIFYISAQFQGAGNTLESSFDIGARESIVLGGLIILVYTLLGGFWAVSLTDTIQGIMMLLASILLPVFAFIQAGAWSGIETALEAQQAEQLLSPSLGTTGLAAAGFILGGLSVGISAFGQPHLVTRFMALRDENALKHAQWLATFWFTIVFFGMCVLGLSMRAIVPQLTNPELLFFEATSLLFPTIIAGVMIAAVLSAIMSTADSMLLVGAAAVSHDLKLAKRYRGKELLISRIAMGVLTLLAIALSLALPASIFDRALFAWVAVGSAFGPVILAKLLRWNIQPAGIGVAMTTSFSLAVLLYFLPNTPGDIAERVLPFCVGVLILRYFFTSK
jgi:SSS family transporter